MAWMETHRLADAGRAAAEAAATATATAASSKRYWVAVAAAEVADACGLQRQP